MKDTSLFLHQGAYGMTSVTRLLKELGWQDLADRRRHHRLILLYKILNCHISVPPDEVSLIRAARPARRTSRSSNPTKLQRPRASHKSSPLWKSPIFRSIPEWNSLPASTAEADSLLAFKSRLAAPKHQGTYQVPDKTRQDIRKLVLSRDFCF